MKKLITILSIIIASNFTSYCQKEIYNTNTRTIIITHTDSVIKANVLTLKEDIKLNDDLKYYWYNNNEIGFNRGGINGKPLHGLYSIYNSENLLLVQGNFNHGLKTGKWKRWYVSGELKKTENYEKGLLNGEKKSFSESGELLETVYYKNGTIVSSEDKSFLSKMFKKEKTAKKDSTQNEPENKDSE